MAEITLEIIGIIVALMVATGGAIAYIVKLQMRITKLENDWKDHPLFSAFRDYEKRDLIKLFDNALRRKENSYDEDEDENEENKK